MAIMCTVLHICNTPPLLPTPLLFLYITLLEYRKLFICDVLHSRYIEKEKKSKLKKRNRQTATGASMRCDRKMSVVTCMVRNLLFELFIVPCLQRFLFSLSYFFLKKVFFLYTVPLTGFPYCHWCLARFKKDKNNFSFLFLFLFFSVEGCREHGQGGLSVFFLMGIPSTTCHLNPWQNAFVQSGVATTGVTLSVVGITLSVVLVSTQLFHTHIIPETSNKTMGMKTFPRRLCCF